MICKKCNYEIPDGAKFCPICGEKQDVPAAYPAPVPPPPPAYGYAQPQESVKDSPKYVGFGEAIKLYFVNYVNFKTRSTRSEYWYAFLFVTLIKICGNIKESAEAIDNSEIYDKIKKLEDKLSSVQAAPQTAEKPAEPEVLTARNPAPDTEPRPTVDIKKLKPEDLVPCERWGEVLEEFWKVNPAVAGSLEGSEAKTAGNIIFITTQNRFFMDLFKQKANAVSLGETLNNVLGQRFVIKARCATSVEQQANMAEELVRKAMEKHIETAVEKGQPTN